MINNNQTRRVVITGTGYISALGNDWQHVKSRILARKNAVRYMQEWEQYSDLKTKLAAPVDNFNLGSEYSAKRKRSMGRVSQMAVAATHTALDHAGLIGNSILKDGSTGVSYGSATGSSDAAVEFFSMLEEQTMSRINTSTYIRMMSHTAAVNIGVIFGTQGRMYTTSSACTAGSQGIGYAYEAIRAGQQTIMIAGGAEELCPTQAAVFDVILAASLRNDCPELSPRPFDKHRDGLVLGEGAATLILEDLEHAQNRNAPILAEIIGFGTNTDGGHMIRPRQATMEKVMELSMADANIRSEEIGYVSAHGTATEHGDIAESRATFNVLGTKPFSSLKSYTGHTLGACGAFELITTINMMQEGWFAPTINLQNVDPDCGDLDYISNEARKIDANVAMSNNFAFGGINTSIIVRNGLAN